MWSGSTTNLLGVVHPGATGGGGCGRFRGALAAVVERAVTGEALGGRENRGGAGVEGATTAAAAAAAAAARYRRDRRPVCQPGVAVVRCAPGIARRLPLHTRVHEALAPARRALLPASIVGALGERFPVRAKGRRERAVDPRRGRGGKAAWVHHPWILKLLLQYWFFSTVF